MSGKIPALLEFISSPVAPVEGAPYQSPPRDTPSVSALQAPQETSPRASMRRMQYELAPSPLLQPKGSYVGELHEQWQFPSDHLPIGMTFEGLNFASWNVLDAKYMKWILANSEGLTGSMLTDEHVYIGETKLTKRDIHVANRVLEMISHPTHPRSLLSMQECSPSFIEELRSRLPAHFEIIVNQGEAILLDKRVFEILEVKQVPGIFSDKPDKTIQEITVVRSDNRQQLRLINTHTPGDPTKPGRFEFAKYLASTFNRDMTTIAMGDMNFNELEMADAMKEAFPNGSPFSLYSPYCTVVAPKVFNSKAIDHFMVYSPENSSVKLNKPNELLLDLEATASLLNKK